MSLIHIKSAHLWTGCLCTEPWVVKSTCEPFQNHFSVVSLLGLVDARPTGFQRQIFWGLISQVLKVGVPNVGFLSSLLIMSCCDGVGVYGEIVLQPLLPASVQAIFLSPNVQKLLRQFLTFFQRRHVVAFGVCLGGDEPRIFSHHHIESEPPKYLLIVALSPGLWHRAPLIFYIPSCLMALIASKEVFYS